MYKVSVTLKRKQTTISISTLDGGGGGMVSPLFTVYRNISN